MRVMTGKANYYDVHVIQYFIVYFQLFGILDATFKKHYETQGNDAGNNKP